MRWIKKIWSGIYSNKRNIGIAAMIINQGIKAFFPELLSADQFKFIDTASLTLAGFGVAHNSYNSINRAKAHKIKTDGK